MKYAIIIGYLLFMGVAGVGMFAGFILILEKFDQ